MLPFTIDPQTETIGDVIRKWAEIQPNAEVFVEEDKTPLSYGGLVEVMDEVRTRLNGCGFGRNDRLAIVHSGGAAMASTLVSVMNCATAIPVNPVTPAEELAAQFHDRGAKALIIEKDMRSSAWDVAHDLGDRAQRGKFDFGTQ